MHGIEKLGGAGGFGCQLVEAGEKGGKNGNVPGAPAGAYHVFLPEIYQKGDAQQGNGPVNGGHGRGPDIGPNGCTLIGCKLLLVGALPVCLPAEDPVGQSVSGPVQGGGAEGSGLLLAALTGFLDFAFQLLRHNIGDEREEHTYQCQSPVIVQQHASVGQQGHAGIEELCGEFPHALHAVIHIPDGFGHDAAFALGGQSLPAAGHQLGIEHLLHAAADVVGKPADIKALEIPVSLDDQDRQSVAQGQYGHFRIAAAAGENIHQLAGHLSFKPGTGQQANVVDKARNGDDQQHLPLRQKVVRHPVRVKCLMLHGFPLAPAALPHPGSPPFSGPCSSGRACPEWRRIA